MKANKGISVQDKEKTIKRINTFFKENLFILAFSFVLMNILTMCSNSNFKSESLQLMKDQNLFLRENIGKVHFLSATGQVAVGEKQKLSYADSRFKSYIQNVLINNLLQGKGSLTGGFDKKISIRRWQDLSVVNDKLKLFKSSFLKKNSTVIDSYQKSLFLAILEKRLPEYMIPTNVGFEYYRVNSKFLKKNQKKTIDGKIRVSVYIKSYIKELGKWDTREVEANIRFKIEINVAEYANYDNPFGIVFDDLDMPTLLKPDASSVERGR